MWKLTNSLKGSSLCEPRGLLLNHIIQNAEWQFRGIARGFRGQANFSSSNVSCWAVGQYFSSVNKKNSSIIRPRISHGHNSTDLSRSFSLLHCERINNDNKTKDFLIKGSLLISKSRNCDRSYFFKSDSRMIYLSKTAAIDSTEMKSNMSELKSGKEKKEFEKDTMKDHSPTEKKSEPETETVAANNTVSKKSLLKQAVKDYGSTVIVFHIAMSLCSLGFFYALISSGLDVVEMMKNIGVGESILQSKITQGASTFVIAYAVHKVFAPARITITLTATPLIVRRLRAAGILKKPIQK